MKTRLMIIVLSIFLSIGLYAQDQQQVTEHKSKKELRKERKEAKKREREEYRLYGKALLESKNFVMKVDRMQNAKGGAVIPTVGTVNFIKIDGDYEGQTYDLEWESGLNPIVSGVLWNDEND